jgi:hypothetical protein
LFAEAHRLASANKTGRIHKGMLDSPAGHATGLVYAYEDVIGTAGRGGYPCA